MKNMSNKKILTIGLAIIAICLAVCVAFMFLNRSTKREPTEAEMLQMEPYAVDWQSAAGTEAGDKDVILAMCDFSEEAAIGQNVYKIYTSDSLGDYLYKFAQMTEIAVLEEVLYIQYTDTDGNTVTLGYTDDGLMEKAVYFPDTDLLYYEQGEITEVWEKFQTGIQWGA